MKIGVGVIGCGGIAQVAHLPAYYELPDVEIVAVAAPSQARTEKVARKYGAKAWYTDGHTLLKRDDIDAVSICTPPELHAEFAIGAAEAGKHVLVEKPLSTSLKDAEEMIRAARKNDIILTTGFMKRFDPGFIKVKEVLEEGIIGRPNFVRLYSQVTDFYYQYLKDITFGGYIEKEEKREPSSISKAKQKIKGLGALINIAIHYIDLLRWLIGDFDRIVNCHVWDIVDGIERNALAFFEMDKGVKAVLECIGGRSVNWKEEMTIHGSKGILYTDSPFIYFRNLPTQPILYTGDAPLGKPLSVLHKDKFVEEIRHFVECARGEKKPLITGEDGKKSLEVIIGCYQSAERKISIDLPLITS